MLVGDRWATAGSMIAERDVEKVFRSDEFSAVGYAGSGSVGIGSSSCFRSRSSTTRRWSPPAVTGGQGEVAA